MFKARVLFAKGEEARFISHLDEMRAMQRALARAKLPVWYTEGFNPHAYVSIALPLATGFSSDCELMDIQFTGDGIPQGAKEQLQAVMPTGFTVRAIAGQEAPVRLIHHALYRITLEYDRGVPAGGPEQVRRLMKCPEILILKKSKRKEEQVNLLDYVLDLSVREQGLETMVVETKLRAGNVNLSPEYVARSIAQQIPELSYDGVRYHRMEVFQENGTIFR